MEKIQQKLIEEQQSKESEIAKIKKEQEDETQKLKVMDELSIKNQNNEITHLKKELEELKNFSSG